MVIIGAGKEGKGTFGDIFHEVGWHITFLDKDIDVIRALLQKKAYQVEAIYENRVEQHEINNYDAYEIKNHAAYEEDILGCDVIVFALYPDDIFEAMANIRDLLKRRAHQNPEKKLTILSGTNKNRMISIYEKHMLQFFDEKELYWYQRNVVFRDMIIRRSANAISTSSLYLSTKALLSLLIQGPVYFDVAIFPWLELRDQLEMFKDIKIFTYNCPHAVCAYAGYWKGYKTIEEAQQDSEIKMLMDACLTEAKEAILKEFPITRENLALFIMMPKGFKNEEELITRVALDPVRKLSEHDRLTGNALLCIKHGIEPKNLIKAIAYGMAYDEPSDKKAQYIQKMISEKGISYAVSKVVGLPEHHDIVQGIVYNYKCLKNPA